MEILHPVDVGAAIGRPRAIDRRRYEFYRKIFVFCNTPSSRFAGPEGLRKAQPDKARLLARR